MTWDLLRLASADEATQPSGLAELIHKAVWEYMDGELNGVGVGEYVIEHLRCHGYTIQPHKSESPNRHA